MRPTSLKICLSEAASSKDIEVDQNPCGTAVILPYREAAGCSSDITKSLNPKPFLIRY